MSSDSLSKATRLRLLIESWSNSARTVRVKGFTWSGAVIDEKHTTNSDRSRATKVVNLPRDVISIVATIEATGVRRGECYVTLSMVEKGADKGDVIDVLTAGYVYDTRPIKWHWLSGGVIEGSTDGRGLIRMVTGTNPPAVATGDSGGMIIETVPAGARWKVHSVRFQIVTSGTGGNRIISLVFDDGTTIFYQIVTQTTIAGSATLNLTGAAGIDEGWASTNTTPDEYPLHLPPQTLLQGWRMRTVVGGKMMADNLGPPYLIVEEWIEA